ncbi:MAG: hypothetical protein J7J72_09825, partial [Bacteroidales bacterium]|nr:hypothetical protein [Bacteroidales bacterium]
MKNKGFFIGVLIAVIFVVSCERERDTTALKNLSSDLKSDIELEGANNTIEESLDTSKILDLKYAIEQLDNTKGLSNSSVNAIFQDSENLLWIGTWDGLNRYDGNNFKIFRPELNNEKSLANQVILKIDEDNAGRIWILTIHGINSYDKKSNTFHRYYFSRENISPLTESEFNMTLDNSKRVFCAIKGWGIGYFDGIDFKLLDTKKLPVKVVKNMEFTSKGELLVLFENNELFLLTLDTKNGSELIISENKIISDNIREFGILPNRKICTILITGDAKVHSLLDNSDVTIDKKDVQKITGYTTEGIILSSKSGYFMIDSSGNIANKPWLKHLNNQKITTLIQGNENIIWTGTDGDGLFKIYPLRKVFNLISKAQVPEIEGGIVRALLVEGGKSIWVGTKGKGVFHFSSIFLPNPTKPLKYEIFDESNSSINNAVFALCKGQDDLIFVGTDGEGINVFDTRNSKLISWSEIVGNELCEYFKSTYTIYQDKKGFIWLGTNGYGMIRLKIERQEERLKVT